MRAAGTESVEARDAAKHPTIHRTDPTTKNHRSRNVNCVAVEKPWSHAIVLLTYQKQELALGGGLGQGPQK